MIIPVRCFSCGKVIASDYKQFKEKISELSAGGKKPTPKMIVQTLDDLHVERYCCRRMILSHTDLIDEVLPFS